VIVCLSDGAQRLKNLIKTRSITVKSKKIFSIYDLCMMGVFAAIIAVMAQIIIPLPYGVPITLQTLAIPLAGVVLGSKRGTITTILYILIGAVGVPVFAGFTGGLGIVFGPTGGFILSFPFLALAAGIGAEKNNRWWLWGGIIVGVLVNYICGVVYFSIFTSNDLITSFVACVLVFIPGDILKITAVALLGERIRKLLLQRGLANTNS